MCQTGVTGRSIRHIGINTATGSRIKYETEYFRRISLPKRIRNGSDQSQIGAFMGIISFLSKIIPEEIINGMHPFVPFHLILSLG